MNWRFWRSKWFVVAVLVVVLGFMLFLLALWVDFGERQDTALRYFSKQEGMPEAFEKLNRLTPEGSVVLCWWDYGRAVKEWSDREVIEAYPSRDISYSVGSTRDPLGNLEAQIFGRWGSSEKIHDLARIFVSPEELSLQIMKRYDVSYVLVFKPDELEKFSWIARIAGYNETDFLTMTDEGYKYTELGSKVTLLRLLFHDLEPKYFTKLYDNGRGKIF